MDEHVELKLILETKTTEKVYNIIIVDLKSFKTAWPLLLQKIERDIESGRLK